jgi:hypothetical protein
MVQLKKISSLGESHWIPLKEQVTKHAVFSGIEIKNVTANRNQECYGQFWISKCHGQSDARTAILYF